MNLLNKSLICISSLVAISLMSPVQIFAADVPEEIQCINYGGHSYAFIKEGMDWKQAEAYCEKLGGHLATVTTPEEQGFIASQIDTQDEEIYNYWLGGVLEDSEWTWVTGETFDYSNWDGFGPDHLEEGDLPIERYLEIYNKSNPFVTVEGVSNAYKWNNIYEDGLFPGQESFFGKEHYGFICEWDFEVESYNRHIYRFIKEGVSWEEAQAECKEANGHLATITSEGEQNFIASQIDTQDEEIYNYWLGGVLEDSEWTWVTGETFDYSNWDGFGPDHLEEGDLPVERYLEIYNKPNPFVAVEGLSKVYKWNNIYEDGLFPGQESFFGKEHYGFICEWEAD